MEKHRKCLGTRLFLEFLQWHNSKRIDILKYKILALRLSIWTLQCVRCLVRNKQLMEFFHSCTVLLTLVYVQYWLYQKLGEFSCDCIRFCPKFYEVFKCGNLIHGNQATTRTKLLKVS